MSSADQLVQAIAAHVDGFRSATFGWQTGKDHDETARNREAAYEAHAAECLRRIRATLGVALPLPPHLRDDAPSLKCTRCGRKSWDTTERGRACNMVRPFGGRCPGQMLAAGVRTSGEGVTRGRN